MRLPTVLLCCFIVLKFFLQFVLISPEYDLHRDEYLHLDQANHLAWGYLSVPPFTSWTSSLIQLLGNTVFWVKFFPALYGVLTMVIVWKAIEALKGSLFALVLGAVCVLFSALLRLNMLYQPNSLDILCWTALYFVLLKYFKTTHTKWLIGGAVIFGIGFLNKYNIVFLIIGLLPALLATPQRKIFVNTQLYLAAVVALCIIAPNLLWQYEHQFPVFHHLKELATTQLVNVSRIAFLKSQLLFFLGAILVLLAAFYALLWHDAYLNYRFFFWSFIFTLGTFMYFKAKDYYAIGIYPIYIAFGAAYLGEVLQKGWRVYLQPVLIAVPLLLFIPLLRVAFPDKSPTYIHQHAEKYRKLGLLRWEDGKDHELPQDFADMLGWKELAQQVDSIYATLPNKTYTLVLCDNYGQAGAINFYTKQNIKAVSFNADYINWFDLTKQYQHLLRIKEQKNTEMELVETAPFFQQSFIVNSVRNQYAREYGTTIFAFIGAKIDIRERLRSEIQENQPKAK